MPGFLIQIIYCQLLIPFSFSHMHISSFLSICSSQLVGSRAPSPARQCSPDSSITWTVFPTDMDDSRGLHGLRSDQTKKKSAQGGRLLSSCCAGVRRKPRARTDAYIMCSAAWRTSCGNIRGITPRRRGVTALPTHPPPRAWAEEGWSS